MVVSNIFFPLSTFPCESNDSCEDKLFFFFIVLQWFVLSRFFVSVVLLFFLLFRPVANRHKVYWANIKSITLATEWNAKQIKGWIANQSSIFIVCFVWFCVSVSSPFFSGFDLVCLKHNQNSGCVIVTHLNARHKEQHRRNKQNCWNAESKCLGSCSLLFLLSFFCVLVSPKWK